MEDVPSYDVALSFAGEDRDYVNDVAHALQQAGVRVFFDEFEEAALWGKDLYTHLIDVYRRRALYTVIFISRHYGQKLWTKLEFKAAASRAFEDSREYILPARFDDTEIEGILPTTGYLKLADRDANQLCEMVIAKLKLDSRFVARIPDIEAIGSVVVGSGSPRAKNGSQVPLDDLQSCELYAGYLHCKTDDLRLIRSVIGLASLGHVVDLCGGYGRAAFELQGADQRWVIVDRSPGMLEISRRLFRGYRSQPEYICADIEDPSFDLLGSFDTALCLYNSINEINDLDKFASLAASSLRAEGRLLVKCIIHDDGYDRTAVNQYPPELCFNLFAHDVVYDVRTEMEDSGSKEQLIRLDFRSEAGLALGSMKWKRWIHEANEIDLACLACGLRMTRTFQGGEYRLYVRE